MAHCAYYWLWWCKMMNVMHFAHKPHKVQLERMKRGQKWAEWHEKRKHENLIKSRLCGFSAQDEWFKCCYAMFKVTIHMICDMSF
jgi:hypothetical protein